MWSCLTSDFSKLSLALAKDVTIKRSASTTMRRTRGALLGPTLQRCAALQRPASARKGHSVRRLTTESNLSITQRSTRRSFAQKVRRKAVTSVICAPSRTVRMNSQLTCCIAWSKTLTSTCSTSKLSGAHSMTKSEVICVTSANTRTIGKTIGASRTSTSICQRSSAAFGALRRRQKTTVMAATWSTAV